jgi:hypothetical protein
MGFGGITKKTEGARGGAKKGKGTRWPTITMRTLVPKDPYGGNDSRDKESGVGVKGTV